MANFSIPSQLCATSTFIGVAAVGYTLGRPQTRLPTRPTSQKRKVQLEDLEAEERGSPLTDPHSSASPLHNSPPTGAPVSAEYVSTTAGRIRRKTSAGWEGLKRLSDIRLDNTSNLDIEARGLERKGSVSSGKAWLQRLSGVSTSRNPSPSPSPGPDSPSISFSNGSTAPMLQLQHVVTEPSQLLAEPNVLVKRSSSQRISLGAASNPMAGRHSRVPSLRRPATSHQRSATMHQNSMMEPFQPSSPGHSLIFDSSRSIPSAAADTDVQWRRYFEPRSLKSFKNGPLPQGNVSSVRPMDSAIRRIAPEGRYRPTLLRATSISSVCKDEDGTSVMSVNLQAESYVEGSSRPATPSDLHLLFAPSDDLEFFPAPTSDGDRPPTRRSFSISDMFGSSPSFRSNRSSASRLGKGGRISLSAGRRYSSAPFPTPTHSPPVSAHAARAPVRRDITDGSLFARQTQTSHCSQSQSPSPFASPASPDSSVWSDINNSPEMGMGMGMDISSHDITPRHRHWQGHSGPVRSSLGASFPSTPPVASTVRTHRSSPAALSERASTLVDSDTELRGPPIAASDEMDFESDTMFDSLRTGATGSSSGGRPLRIETMFDESPPPKTSTGRLHVGHTILPMSYHVIGSGDVTHDIPEENESISTPRKLPDVPDSDTHGTDVDMTSPHSSSQHALSLGKLSWDAHGPLESMPTWTMDEDEDEEEEEDWSKMEEDTAIENHLSSPQSARVVQVYALAGHDGVRIAAPGNGQMSTPSMTSTKVSVERRGSRSTGRRTLDAVHLRSQSVPVIADPDSQRERGAAASKFGTWGLGSKAVSEDWNEDFEFDGLDVSAGDDAGHGGAHDGGKSRSIFVPAAIRERQAQVIGHLGHVKEFAQLVEELKHLRGLARSRRIVTGPLAELWKEADGIIDLATLDDDRQDLPSPTSPSSSAFDAFDEEPVPAPLHDRHRRKSVLGLDDDIFGGAAMTDHNPDHDDRVSEVWSPSLSYASVSPQPADRQSASAVARSVVETMHQRRTSSDPILSNASPTKQSKMPFDTTTLRDLVAHVNVLSQKLAEDVRNAEGNTIMPSASPKSGPVPSLEQVLAGSAASSPSFGKGRAQRRKNSNGAIGGSRTGKENDMSGPLPMMAFV